MWRNIERKRNLGRKENKKPRKVLLCALIFIATFFFLMTVSTTPTMATVCYENKYIDGLYSIYIEYPLDIPYRDLTNHVNIFPLVVDVLAYPYEAWVTIPLHGKYFAKYVPSHIQIELYVRDASNLDDVPTWMDINDTETNFLVKGNGTSVKFSYTVGISKTFRSGESFKVGDNYSIYWSYTSSPVLKYNINHTHWTTISKYYHLGKIDAYMAVQPEDYKEQLRALIPVSIPSDEAQLRCGDVFQFFVRVKILYTMYFQVFWWWVRGTDDVATKNIEFSSIGNGFPSTDAILHLIPAQKISYQP